VVLLGFLGLTGRLGAVGALTPSQAGWTLATGLLLGGYVATWFAALRRAPATLVTAVLVVGAPITAALQAVSTGGLPAGSILAGHGLILAAGVLLAGSAVLARRGRRASLVPAA
jgi:hypothetical protein